MMTVKTWCDKTYVTQPKCPQMGEPKNRSFKIIIFIERVKINEPRI